jgi:hypothetical protein
MKKLFLVLLIVILLSVLMVGCGSSKNFTTIHINNDTLKYEIVTIDKCEYIIGTDNGGYNGGYFMAHKGNCSNPIHLYK